jgi:hypothetical protein
MKSLRTAFAVFLLASGCSSSAATTSDSGEPPVDGSIQSDANASNDSGGSGQTDAPGVSCPTGSVDFRLQQDPGSTATYCLGPSGSCSGNDWLSILPADGGTELGLVMQCVPNCGDCQPVACSNLCALASPLTDAGAHLSWDGTYLRSGTCGGGTSCTASACAAAGNYVARLCGYAEPPDASSSSLGPPACTLASQTPTCTDIPFVWPPPSGTASFTGTIGAAELDGGASD